ncbi:unnamed protein product [Durusdinium trenchii]|uniref:Uncharacterized protein n=1 Tax=Durusdinium trenchii TaxID=1381693 RepID=A0ABP0JGU8_9DINO
MAFDSNNSMAQCVSRQCEIIKHGVLVATQISSMTGLGRDAKARVLKDAGRLQLGKIIRLGAQLLASREELSNLEVAACPTQNLPGLDSDAAAAKDADAVTTAQTEANGAPSAAANAATAPPMESEGTSAADQDLASVKAGQDIDVDDVFASPEMMQLALVVVPAAAAPECKPEESEATATAATATSTTQPEALGPLERIRQITIDMFNLDPGSAFSDMLQGELVQDFILQHIASCREQLDDIGLKMQGALGPFKDVSWNWEVEGALGRSGATVEELLEAAKPIMVKMPVKGQAFSDIVQKMSSVAATAKEFAEQMASARTILTLPLMTEPQEKMDEFMRFFASQTALLRRGRALFVTTVLILALKLSKQDQESQQNAKRLIREHMAAIRGGQDGMQDVDVPLSVRENAEKLLL